MKLHEPTFLQNGYEIVSLSLEGHRLAMAARNELQANLGPLEEYHGDSLELHALAAKHAAGWVRQIIEAELDYFTGLLGADLLIQQKPFLRISRPGVPDDNIGLHRDTWYGDTPYEISVWIPFTDTDEGNALRVAPGSHLWSETAYPVERFDGSVEKGSIKHSLGFIAGRPKRLATPAETTALPVRVGQMIVFSLALLHGQEVNRSTRTRLSMDVRLTNALAPVRMARSRDERYYQPLSTTPVTEAARRYYAVNAS